MKRTYYNDYKYKVTTCSQMENAISKFIKYLFIFKFEPYG